MDGCRGACCVRCFIECGIASANILLIISDDQGYSDFGFTGNKLADTPVLDQLSKDGAFYPWMVGTSLRRHARR